ncbi:MAG: U32 family peptidase [bacterium]
MAQTQSTPAKPRPATELLAPAGDIESAYAAFKYGADAVYLGLRRFSARAEATNFSSDELGEIVAFAHAAKPRRRVFAAVNTVVQNRQLSELIDTLADAAESGVDALIVQDLGVAYIARKHFPALALHASTQLAIHNLAGAKALRSLGFRRVTLARELTLDEVRDIARNSGIEVEVFIHGALCYSYSGLCLYSSLLRTGSGNRGRCAYPCRDLFEPATPGGQARFPFSMKDLALVDNVEDLRAAGVLSFKIEGRKKSPLYVASTTAYYRALLDGRSTEDSRRKAEADMKTIFSRPWTRLYLDSRRNPQVVDTEVVGHRGVPIGKIAEVMQPNTRSALLRFTTQRRIERYDGLQLDISGGRPYGFSVEAIGLEDARTVRFTNVFEAPAGSRIGVPLPSDHPPLKAGMTVYCSSSQSVKQSYPYERARPGQFRFRRPLNVAIVVKASGIQATGTLDPDSVLSNTVSAQAEASGTFDIARKTTGLDDAFRNAFSKLGDTGFLPGSLTVYNDQSRFVPVSILNQLRRDLVATLEAACAKERARTLTAIKSNSTGNGNTTKEPVRSDAIDWSIKVARAHVLSGLQADDWTGISEAVVDITRDPLPALTTALQKLETVIGRERIRLSLPVITREWEKALLEEKITSLTNAGWNRWEFANISGLTYLASANGVLRNLATDWSVYVLNRAAALQVLELGASRFILSPEDDFENIRELLSEFPEQATLLMYQDTPLFISENCPKANAGGCTGGRRTCPDASSDLLSSAREEVSVLNHECRTVVISDRPFNLVSLLGEIKNSGARHLCADFSWKPYGPAQVADILKTLRSGVSNMPGHTGNMERKLK